MRFVYYSYDVPGRLVGTAYEWRNNNGTTSYTYDKADNRTNVNVVSPNAYDELGIPTMRTATSRYDALGRGSATPMSRRSSASTVAY